GLCPRTWPRPCAGGVMIAKVCELLDGSLTWIWVVPPSPRIATMGAAEGSGPWATETAAGVSRHSRCDDASGGVRHPLDDLVGTAVDAAFGARKDGVVVGAGRDAREEDAV